MQQVEIEKTETQMDESHMKQYSYMATRDEKMSRNFERSYGC